MCSIQRSILKSDEKFLAAIMMEGLDFCMPGVRCIVSEDISRAFSELEGKFGLERAKKLCAVPSVLYFCSLDIADMKNWIEETIKKGRVKKIIESSEIMQLLINIKSTYGILEVQYKDVPRSLIFSVTPTNQ